MACQFVSQIRATLTDYGFSAASVLIQLTWCQAAKLQRLLEPLPLRLMTDHWSLTEHVLRQLYTDMLIPSHHNFRFSQSSQCCGQAVAYPITLICSKAPRECLLLRFASTAT